MVDKEFPECFFCKKPVDPDSPGTLVKVTGWEKRRGQGGANMIHLREQGNSFAHYSCVELTKLGVSVHQQTLV